MINKLVRMLASVAVAFGSLFFVTAITAAPASSDPCVGTWTIGVGGFEWGGAQRSLYIPAWQPMGYNVWDPAGAKNELNRLFWDHRNQCPGDHIKIIAHSEGAGIAHSWVTENQWIPNANAVLLGDPKRNGWDTGMGIAQYGSHVFPGYPLSGVDDWFGDFPVLQVCNWGDIICRVDAGPNGYLFEGKHNYNYDPNAYGDWDRGTWML